MKIRKTKKEYKNILKDCDPFNSYQIGMSYHNLYQLSLEAFCKRRGIDYKNDRSINILHMWRYKKKYLPSNVITGEEREYDMQLITNEPFLVGEVTNVDLDLAINKDYLNKLREIFEKECKMNSIMLNKIGMGVQALSIKHLQMTDEQLIEKYKNVNLVEYEKSLDEAIKVNMGDMNEK